MTPFALGRMRHLDLLALWHQLNPDGHDTNQAFMGTVSGDQLATAILQTRGPRP